MATLPSPQPNATTPLTTALFAVTGVLLVLVGLRLGALNPIGAGFVPTPAVTPADGPVLDEYVVNPNDIAHAVSVVLGSDGNVRAAWYEGTGEATPDVRIFS